jgi:hypothetical protein
MQAGLNLLDGELAAAGKITVENTHVFGLKLTDRCSRFHCSK